MILNKNILTVTDGAICHVVNPDGVMGAGLALQIAKKYPIVKEDYIKSCNNGLNYLGYVSDNQINHKLWIFNLFAMNSLKCLQPRFQLPAFEECLSRVIDTLPSNIKVYVPEKIGCGLAGGNWAKTIKVIEGFERKIYICHYEDVSNSTHQ